jgi:proline racemase/trans-L-3-hydroxyproline dehydratase
MLPRVISSIESHTAGEPTRVIIGGIPNIPGQTMADKSAYFNRNYDHIRRALMKEPRGSRAMFGVLLTDAVSNETDFGVIFMDATKTVDMCGHASIGAATAAVECGIVPAKEPVTEVRFDTVSGVIIAKVTVKDGRAISVTIRGAPSFFYKPMTIDVPGLGKVDADISFGGNFFALVDASKTGIDVRAENVYELVVVGKKILQHANQQLHVQHPIRTEIKNIFGVQIIAKPSRPEAHSKNVTIGMHSQVDRSPCGSGTCARLAALWSKGELKLNEDFVYESIIGTIFSARAVQKTKIGEYDGVVPEVTGSAYLTGTSTFLIDPRDPLREGFLLT